eukprot:gnl/TRDRNA2_/TRDRNA2_128200_c0_seq1.p1 gnl/TRDRNA2_/TRDRNA2_128200_c0~~gnl/TRDRNA2_/TRDRNA2_128200_c0_seq1.p1  ORF type:complete len:530 (-),score=58.14 gnl/TRDRNA2_/TRDRNA2_128200_c0_seq1:58-1596(-)
MYGANKCAATNFALLPEKSAQAKPTLMNTSFRMWRLLLVVGFFYSLEWAQKDLSGPFIRSLVVCDWPVPSVHGCPVGSVFDGKKTCTPLPPTSKEWSGSELCMDRHYVLKQGTARAGSIMFDAAVFSMFANIFIGVILIDSWGRKSLIMLALLGMCANFAVWLFASQKKDGSSRIEWVLVGQCIGNLLNAFQAAALAMASDLTPHDPTMRGLAYTALNICQYASIVVGFAGGYFVLSMNLGSYSRVWFVVAILGLSAVFLSYLFLHETARKLADPASVGLCEKREQMPGPVTQAATETLTAFQLLWREQFLRLYLLLTGVTSIAIHGTISIVTAYAMSYVNLTQSTASLTGVVQPAAITCGSLIFGLLIRHCSPYYAHWFGDFVLAAGMIIIALGGALPAVSGALYWGGSAVMGTGLGIGMVAANTVMCMRVDRNGHGKLFSCTACCNIVGSAVGNILWTHLLFDSDAVGWGASRPFLWSAAVVAVCALCKIVLYIIYVYPECEEVSEANEC